MTAVQVYEGDGKPLFDPLSCHPYFVFEGEVVDRHPDSQLTLAWTDTRSLHIKISRCSERGLNLVNKIYKRGEPVWIQFRVNTDTQKIQRSQGVIFVVGQVTGNGKDGYQTEVDFLLTLVEDER